MTDTPFTPLTTTLNRIRVQCPCPEGWDRGLEAAGKSAPDDEPILYADMARRLNFSDTLWCCRAEPQFNHHWRLFAVWCARQVQHLITDQHSLNALDTAERHTRGEATNEELTAALDAARDSVRNIPWDSGEVTIRFALRSALLAASTFPETAVFRASEWAIASCSDPEDAWRAQRAAFIQFCETGTLPPV